MMPRKKGNVEEVRPEEIEAKLLEGAEKPEEVEEVKEAPVKETEALAGVSPLRPTWEEFLRLWDSSPAVMFEAGAYGVLASKFDIPSEALERSRLVPAIAYIPAWYLWPMLSSASEEQMPPAFRPLARSLATLLAVVLSEKLKGGEAVGSASVEASR